MVKRFDYVVRIASIAGDTGETGSSKSTAFRYAGAKLPPAEYKSIYVLATSGSILKLYRQIVLEMGWLQSSNSKLQELQGEDEQFNPKKIIDLINDKRLKTVLTIDGASLLRLEVLAELHTLCQFEKDYNHFLLDLV